MCSNPCLIHVRSEDRKRLKGLASKTGLNMVEIISLALTNFERDKVQKLIKARQAYREALDEL